MIQHVGKVIITILAVLILAADGLMSQTANALLANGSGIDRKTAIANARKKLSEKVANIIYKNGDFSLYDKSLTPKEFISAIAELVEEDGLVGVQIDTLPKKDLSSHVSASISFQNALDGLRQGVKDIIVKAQDQERRNLKASALTLFYRSYLGAIFLQDQAQQEAMRKQIFQLLKSPELVFLPGQAVVSKESSKFLAIQTPIKVLFNDQKVSNLWMRVLYPGSVPALVQNGRTMLLLYGDRDNKKKKYKVVYGPTTNADVPKSSLGNLYLLTNLLSVSDTTQLEIDFSRVVDINFSISHSNDTTYFGIKSKNVSISDKKPAVWLFGDGSSTIGYNVKHFYKKRGEYVVSMQVNGVDDFTRVKDIEILGAHRYNILRDSVEYVTEETEKDDVNAEKIDRIISTLIQRINQSPSDFLSTLEDYRFKGDLLFGREGDFLNLSDCYVFLVTRDTKRLRAVLESGEKSRKNRLSNELIKNPKLFMDQYPNDYKVWIEIQ